MMFIGRKTVLASCVALALAAPAVHAAQGPSSSQTPYLVPADPAVTFTSILTAGDAVVALSGGVPRIEGTVEEVAATFGVAWVRDRIGERRLLLDGDFVLHRRTAVIPA